MMQLRKYWNRPKEAIKVRSCGCSTEMNIFFLLILLEPLCLLLHGSIVFFKLVSTDLFDFQILTRSSVTKKYDFRHQKGMCMSEYFVCAFSKGMTQKGPA